MLNINKIIRAYRIEKNFTQDDIASHCNVSKATVSKWETGKSYPDIMQLPRIAQLFNVSVDELLDYKRSLTKMEMRRKYQELSKMFTKQDFEDTLFAIDEEAKTYFHLYDFLNLLATLIINHMSNAKTDKEIHDAQKLVLKYTEHILTNSHDVREVEEAEAHQIIVYDMQGESEMIIDALKDTVRPSIPLSPLLAKSYIEVKDIKSAEMTLQVDLFQSVLQSMDILLSMLYTPEIKPNQKNEIIRKIEFMDEAFNINTLNPNKMINANLVIALFFARDKDTESVIYYLKKSVRSTKQLFENFKLHGDAFFTLIDEWIDDLVLGSAPPQSKASAKETLITTIENNPSFSYLVNNMDFKNILFQLEKINTKE